MTLPQIEVGDLAAWAGFFVAALSLAWHVRNELTARAAGRKALLRAEVSMASNDRVFVKWMAEDVGSHTPVRLSIRLRGPKDAAMVHASVTGPLDDLQSITFGPSTRLIEINLVRDAGRLWGRMYVMGLPTAETPFSLDVSMLDVSTGTPVLKRRRWSMMASRPGMFLEASRH